MYKNGKESHSEVGRVGHNISQHKQKVSLNSPNNITAQRLLIIDESPNSPFDRLKYGQYKSLFKRWSGKKEDAKSEDKRRQVNALAEAWPHLKLMAGIPHVFMYNTWNEAIQKADDDLKAYEKKSMSGNTLRDIKDYVSKLQYVNIGILEGVNSGNIMSAILTMQSLIELGFKNKFYLFCSEGAYNKVKSLAPDIMTYIKKGKQDSEFDAQKSYNRSSDSKSDGISIMTNGDNVDDDSQGELLNYFSDNKTLILNPYGWKIGGKRRVIINDGKIEMPEDIDAEALYRRKIEAPANISDYMESFKKQVNQEYDNMSLLLENVIKKLVMLQPVYGIRLPKNELVNFEAMLSNGIHNSKINQDKPVVVMILNSNSHLEDYIYEKEWIIRCNIRDNDFSGKLKNLKSGQVMLLTCGFLPDKLFTQIFRLATLPPVIEGANSSNLMQSIGKQWMSPRLNTTAYPYSDLHSSFFQKEIRSLNDVTSALSLNDTNWSASVDYNYRQNIPLDLSNMQKEIGYITSFIDNSYDPESSQSKYFNFVFNSAKSYDRDQVLQGLLLLMKAKKSESGEE